MIFFSAEPSWTRHCSPESLLKFPYLLVGTEVPDCHLNDPIALSDKIYYLNTICQLFDCPPLPFESWVNMQYYRGKQNFLDHLHYRIPILQTHIECNDVFSGVKPALVVPITQDLL